MEAFLVRARILIGIILIGIMRIGMRIDMGLHEDGHEDAGAAAGLPQQPQALLLQARCRRSRTNGSKRACPLGEMAPLV